METSTDDARLKELLKQAILEILDERREVLSEVLMEALEDIAMAAAIKEGENTPLVSREDIFQLLEG